jgi:hypothetical protein
VGQRNGSRDDSLAPHSRARGYVNEFARQRVTSPISALIALVTVVLAQPARADLRVVTLSGASYTVDFSRENGSIVRFAARGRTDSIWHSGEHGLWQFTVPGLPGTERLAPPPEPVKPGGTKYLWSGVLRGRANWHPFNAGT